jgi:hypothetical protein
VNIEEGEPIRGHDRFEGLDALPPVLGRLTEHA